MKNAIRRAAIDAAIIAGTIVFILALVLLVMGPAHGAPIEYDAQAAMSRRMIEPVALRTVQCMREGAENMLRMGMRDDNELAQWLATTCGLPLGSLMMSEIGLSQRDAATYLFAMGHAAIRETPGVRRPAR